jgi:hypothetical protein
VPYPPLWSESKPLGVHQELLTQIPEVADGRHYHGRREEILRCRKEVKERTSILRRDVQRCDHKARRRYCIL